MSLYVGSDDARIYVGNTVATKVYLGNSLIWEDQTFYKVAGVYYYTIPAWSQRIDVVALGGGAGGGGGAWINWVPGGRAGTWATATLVRGTNIPMETTTLELHVGAGGAGSSGSITGTTGNSGGSTWVFGSGMTPLGAAGGAYQGAPDPQTGQAAGAIVYNGRTYQGGQGGVSGVPGVAPGGGGGGGAGGGITGGQRGGDGAPGGVWIYPY